MSAPQAVKNAARLVTRQTIEVGKFPFPTKSKLVPRFFGPQKAALAPKRKAGKGGHRLLKRPVFPHMGTIETEGHRTRGGRWIRARGVVGKPRVKGGKPARGMIRKYGWTHPYNRVRQWFIWEGDQVRIKVGSASVKYENPEKGAAGGWKVYTVSSVNMTKNRVYLKEHMGKKSSKSSPRPADFDTWTQEKQEAWNYKNEVAESPKPIQISNISLLLKKAEDPKNHVWSRRIKTSTAKWSAREGKWIWQRYAIPDRDPSRVRGEWDSLVVEPSGQTPSRWIRVEYPAGTTRELDKSNIEYDLKVDDHTVSSEKLESVTAGNLHTVLGGMNVHDFIPNTTTSGPPKSQVVAELYRKGKVEGVTAASVDTLMPMYLSEELSPRYSNHTTRELTRARIALRQVEKKEYIEAAVNEWKVRGRDRLLREIMDTDEAGLRGVVLRPRSEREIREVAAIEWEQETSAKLADVAKKFKQGWLWDYNSREGGWIRGPRAERHERKRLRRVKKSQRVDKLLQELTLAPGKNMYVPEEARREVPQVVKKAKRKAKDVVAPTNLFAKYLRS